MTILVTYQRDQGKVRERQEDSCFAFADDQKGLLILSDGMGGHAKGDEASQASVAAATDILQQWPATPRQNLGNGNDSTHDVTSGVTHIHDSNELDEEESPPYDGMTVEEWVKPESLSADANTEIPYRAEVVSAIQNAFNHAQEAVCEVGADVPFGLGSAGCTLTAALITNGWLHVGHIGDSRAYLFRNGQLEQLTMDHSGATLLVSAGIISPEEARHHPDSHSLYRFLGINAVELTVDLHHEKLQAGDVVLLCSDGLWGMLPDEQIAAILHEFQSVEAAAYTLLFEANKAGGEDNISVAIARV